MVFSDSLLSSICVSDLANEFNRTNYVIIQLFSVRYGNQDNLFSHLSLIYDLFIKWMVLGQVVSKNKLNEGEFLHSLAPFP